MPDGACRLILRVSPAQYKAVDEVRRRWSKSGQQYKAKERDCVTFSQEVARVLDLKVPERSEATFPQDFVTKLIEKNK